MKKHTGTNRIVRFAALTTVLLTVTLDGRTQTDSSIRGFSPTQAKEHRAWEEKMRSSPQSSLLREYMEVLAGKPHAIGSPKGKSNAEWMLNKLRSWGLDASIEEYQVLVPLPKERVLELVSPEKYTARLKEPAVPEDPDTGDAGQIPTFNAFSGDGDVTAQVVYVNYGLPGDYETLKRFGVDVKGKIVLARYGASWRGIKPKVAYENGAVGCLMYSDPMDDGYYQGAVYPEGPYRPEQGVQRGSVVDMPVYPGDPLTPGVGATAEAKRLDVKDAATIMKIPVMPISWGDALPILKSMRGPVAPESWRGALPTTYFVGPGPAVVHFRFASDWSLRTAYDVIARIEGSLYPNELVIHGNHHDAWVNGASDPVTGLIALLEEARALAELVKQGWRPKRTIVLAAWDGEEFGLLGSTEWGERHAAELKENGVVYINTDSSGRGWYDASGSHSLERFMHEVARDVPDPLSGRSIYEEARAHAAAQSRIQQKTARTDARMGALGSGSDYTVFIDHLGISSLNLGFGGADPGGVYHSSYDTLYWFNHFSDSKYLYVRTLAQLDGTAVMRLADAPVLPFKFTNLAETIGTYLDELEKLAQGDRKTDLAPLKTAQQSLMKTAQGFEQAYSQAASGEAIFQRSAAQLGQLNKILYQSERALLSPEGLPRRPWFRHQLYAPGLYTGYGVKTIPYVREAIEQGQGDDASRGIEVVRQRLLALTARIESARKLLLQIVAP